MNQCEEVLYKTENIEVVIPCPDKDAFWQFFLIHGIVANHERLLASGQIHKHDIYYFSYHSFPNSDEKRDIEAWRSKEESKRRST